MADRGTQTGGSSGGRGGGIPLGAGSQTIKGGLLVLAAVVLGIVLLQVVDPGKSGPVAQRPTTTTNPVVTTTTTKKPKTTTTVKGGTTAPKTPAFIKLLVMNAGAPTGSAKSVSTALKGKGYTFQGTPTNDPNKRSVSEVLCRAGFTREATTLAVLLGKGTTHGTFGNPAPPGSSGFDCVVLVGAQGVK